MERGNIHINDCVADGNIDASIVNVNTVNTPEGNLSAIIGYIRSLSTQVAYVRHEEPSGTPGGHLIAGMWNVRTLNTISSDPYNIIVSLNSNEFTLDVGTYEVNAVINFDDTTTGETVGTASRVRLFNVTDTSVEIVGQTPYIDTTSNQNWISTNQTINGIF